MCEHSKEDLLSSDNLTCKYCGSNRINKKGTQASGNKRFYCRESERTFCLEDRRIKHTIEERVYCIVNYLNGMSMRKIQKGIGILFKKKIYLKTIEHCIRNANKILREELEEKIKNLKAKEIILTEWDELFTYIKKNPEILQENLIVLKEYGLLLIGMKVL